MKWRLGLSKTVVAICVAATAATASPPAIAAAEANPADELSLLDVQSERRANYEDDEWRQGGYGEGLVIGDRCDTRCELLREHRRPDGTWLSSYDGFVSANPSDFEVDHVVSLNQAFRSGGFEWTRERRWAFFNDQNSGELRVVSAESNQTKSNKGPTTIESQAWLPPSGDPAVTCSFVADWIHVKAVWGLSVDVEERDALISLTRSCGWERSSQSCLIGAPSDEYRGRFGERGAASIWRLYQAFFLRQPDSAGFDYWISQHRNGLQLTSMAELFASSEEFAVRYDSYLADSEYVELVYSNVLCRIPDGEGLSYWSSDLRRRRLDRGTLMVQFSESTEYRALTASG